jgi:hypothetical protein
MCGEKKLYDRIHPKCISPYMLHLGDIGIALSIARQVNTSVVVAWNGTARQAPFRMESQLRTAAAKRTRPATVPPRIESAWGKASDRDHARTEQQPGAVVLTLVDRSLNRFQPQPRYRSFKPLPASKFTSAG